MLTGDDVKGVTIVKFFWSNPPTSVLAGVVPLDTCVEEISGDDDVFIDVFLASVITVVLDMVVVLPIEGEGVLTIVVLSVITPGIVEEGDCMLLLIVSLDAVGKSVMVAFFVAFII